MVREKEGEEGGAGEKSIGGGKRRALRGGCAFLAKWGGTRVDDPLKGKPLVCGRARGEIISITKKGGKIWGSTLSNPLKGQNKGGGRLRAAGECWGGS